MLDIEECRVIPLTECTYKVAYLGGRMLLRYKTQPPHGDKVCSVYFPESDNELPYQCYLRNIRQMSIDKSTGSPSISVGAIKPHQWSDAITLITDPKHNRSACLDDWYPSIKIEEGRISYHSAYTEEEYILHNFQLPNWQSL